MTTDQLWIATLHSDQGVHTLRVRAPDEETAANLIMAAELCPRRSILRLTPTSLTPNQKILAEIKRDWTKEQPAGPRVPGQPYPHD